MTRADELRRLRSDVRGSQEVKTIAMLEGLVVGRLFFFGEGGPNDQGWFCQRSAVSPVFFFLNF